MKAFTEELFSKWVDDCLTPEEQAIVDAAAKEDPSLLSEMESIRGLSSQLKEQFPASQEPPYPDFFNTRVMNKITQNLLNKSAPSGASVKSPWWSKLGFGWVPASALAAVLAFFAGTKMNRTDLGPEMTRVELPSIYTPGENHVARIISNQNGEVAAIVMDGLDAIGDEVDFATADATASLPVRYLISQERSSF